MNKLILEELDFEEPILPERMLNMIDLAHKEIDKTLLTKTPDATSIHGAYEFKDTVKDAVLNVIGDEYKDIVNGD